MKLRGVFASAVLDRGLSAPAARRALAAGDLPGWTGAYELPLSTGQEYVKAERQRRRETLLHRADPATVQTAVAGQVALLLAELDRRTRAVTGSTSLDDIRELARAQREVVATARACQPRGAAAPGAGDDSSEASGNGDADAAPDLLDQLAA